jgi:hypothetical protein
MNMLDDLDKTFRDNQYFMEFKEMLIVACRCARSDRCESISQYITKHWGDISPIGYADMLGNHDVAEFLKGVCDMYHTDAHLWGDYCDQYYNEYFKATPTVVEE